jgi:hypothetical protein
MLRPEHIKIKLFYQTSAYMKKEKSISNHCLQSQNSAVMHICVAGYFVSLPFSILSTQFTVAIPLTLPDHNECAIKWVLEFHTDSFKELQKLKTVSRQ